MFDPIKDINEATNIALENQNALGFAMPPFIPFKDIVTVKNAEQIDADANLKSRLQRGLVENTNWIVPLTFKATGLDDFKFPLDPIISLSSKNIIIRRYVNKSGIRGSIKERWSQDDWEISISGVVISANGKYPEATVEAISKFCDIAESVDVECILLNKMNIHQISIESLEFPFTKGIENQAFVIKAYSDDIYPLLSERK